ncbi:MAG: glycosyltransferase [Clostridia bacterium]|nr:glycosyltransferase [Clostridia bacterium]
MKLTIIIPMFNESAIVSDTAGILTGYLENWAAETGNTYEVLFSNDGSRDDCGDRVCTFAADTSLSHGSVSVVEADRNYGKGHAITIAMAEASGDFVLYTDCDLAYGVDVIGEAVALWQETGCDVLIGSRNLHADGYAGYTFLRKLASKAYIRVLCLVAGFHLSDSQCGFKGFRREIGQAVFAENGTWGWAFDIEILLRAMDRGAVIREMPVKIINHRESKIRLVRDSVRMVKDILKIRTRLRAEKKAGK